MSLDPSFRHYNSFTGLCLFYTYLWVQINLPMQNVTAIFDIGKTNKKFILYDQKYNEVLKISKVFSEIEDEDGFPCDNIYAIVKWIYKTLNEALNSSKHRITELNFSTYGASFIYIDENDTILTPLYNYLKPYPKNILKSFYKKYGSESKIAKQTASPPSEMLNSGLQLYWIKKTKPKIYKKIKYAIHFPQYLSYLFTEIPLSDFTSIGCHTSLWNYKNKAYHSWVAKEEIDKILPPLTTTNKSINTYYNDKYLKVGIGIHDSSAALLPYFMSDSNPFILVSTGTWSITLNPFNQEVLTYKDLKSDTLNYMRIDGLPVKATRLFLGKEYEIQVKKLNKYFRKEKDEHTKIKASKSILKKAESITNNRFKMEVVLWKRKQPKETNLAEFTSFEEAYIQLIVELVTLQVTAIQKTLNNKKVKKIYIDGGFVNNTLFTSILSSKMKGIEVFHTKKPIGSSLGAAIVISDKKIKSNFLKQTFGLIKVK